MLRKWNNYNLGNRDDFVHKRSVRKNIFNFKNTFNDLSYAGRLKY